MSTDPIDFPPAAIALEPSVGGLGFRTKPSSQKLLARPLGRIGSLEIKLAESAKEIRRAQRLRYRVFFEEMQGAPSMMARFARRDADPFDAVCDHLLVTDHQLRAPKPTAVLPGLKGFDVGAVDPSSPFRMRKPKVVGTYRLLRGEVADRTFGFYSASEFEVDGLVSRHPRLSFLELGRSCVLEPYRDKRTVELLWHGIWAYVLAHGVDVMIGCASLEGTDPERLALPLSYLHHFHAAPPQWRVPAVESRRAEMRLLAREAIDPRAALRALPPLIKGYLRLGAFIGDGAVVDHAFGTTDVLIVLPRQSINPRYVAYYGADAGRHAA